MFINQSRKTVMQTQGKKERKKVRKKERSLREKERKKERTRISGPKGNKFSDCLSINQSNKKLGEVIRKKERKKDNSNSVMKKKYVGKKGKR